ncbi:hypothetical protein AU106_gp237 [Sinorhizobium phage phiM9]|uniref:Uncharacterized protein n=1 Tax=Sinorhizobium phage phiM9 TaxID=1636182 RepID=A0A0F6R7R7_9CAUD|nr:hypothetical protein AU106_gp237 [Sinorhizobium phage phiM9]AKE44868.1 hypothetical protein Sm_phiM9_241 [Sinorhizobium phage phiM9]
MYRVYRRIKNPHKSELESRKVGYIFRGLPTISGNVAEIDEFEETVRYHHRDHLEEIVS